MIKIKQNKLFGDIKITVSDENAGYVPSDEELTTN